MNYRDQSACGSPLPELSQSQPEADPCKWAKWASAEALRKGAALGGVAGATLTPSSTSLVGDVVDVVDVAVVAVVVFSSASKLEMLKLERLGADGAVVVVVDVVLPSSTTMTTTLLLLVGVVGVVGVVGSVEATLSATSLISCAVGLATLGDTGGRLAPSHRCGSLGRRRMARLGGASGIYFRWDRIFESLPLHQSVSIRAIWLSFSFS